jgi:hypothetical protein
MFNKKPSPPAPTTSEALSNPEIVEWVICQRRDGMKVLEEVGEIITGENSGRDGV